MNRNNNKYLASDLSLFFINPEICHKSKITERILTKVSDYEIENEFGK